MQFKNIQKPLVIIVGPTAVGKTEMSIELAERFNGEIVSADSRLLYRGMDIGTDKPSHEERRRVPHHLIDVANPDETWSLSLYQRAAYQAIEDIQSRGHLPFLVGGTGQYIRSIIQGWQPPQHYPDKYMRNILEAWGNEIGTQELHRRLKVLDPLTASRIDPNNLRRIIRAMEVIFNSGQKFSYQSVQKGTAYSILIIGITRPRVELYQRIDDRIEQMLIGGLVEEVRFLLLSGYSPDLPAFSAIGYRQVIDILADKISIDEAEIEIKKITRQFVRRQANWFKERDANIHWFKVRKETLEEISVFIDSGYGWIKPHA